MPNRLARELSPYLRQHAHNPVDWYPWGPEALAAARERDVPILLSVGYSACHWCHVMERESFDDPQTAEVMNHLFVNIKVDREERPDIDGIYMGAVQALTGRGGWPLTAFLTPDGRPFYGGTYFPPEARQGMPAFRQVLGAVHDAWQDRRDEVEAQADRLARGSRPPSEPAEGSPVDPSPGPGHAGSHPLVPVARDAFNQLAAAFDPERGGFGDAPKFPQPVTLEFLLAWAHAEGSDRAREMALHTLRCMARGGLRDHLGGGFHRYAVDRAWLVPHFEKMLYDNALLARVYLDGWRVSGDNGLAAVCRETLRYILADLRAPSGAFLSARDADSEGQEGRFYVWSPQEIRRAAAASDVSGAAVERFLEVFHVTDEGNFEGRNILHLPEELEKVAERKGLDPAALDRELSAVATALRGARETRVPPFRDEKIICAWNGFAIRALAEAGAALPEPDFVRAAAKAGEALFDTLVSRDGSGRISLSRIRAGRTSRIAAYLEDWASLGNAALSLYEATLDVTWYHRAVELLEGLLERFGEAGSGLLFDAPLEADGLIHRPRDLADSATPSGNSMAVELLLRLGAVSGRRSWLGQAEAHLARDVETVRRAPAAFGRRLTQGIRLGMDPVEIALVADLGDPASRALLHAAHGPYHPARVVAGRHPEAGPAGGPALLDGRNAPVDTPTAWVCTRFACQAPVHDADALTAALSEAD